LRAFLLRLADEVYILRFTTHHIVSDGWSLLVFSRELGVTYTALAAGSRPGLPELKMQYVDFARWQKARLQDEVVQKQLGYWRQQLADSPNLLALPTDYPRPPVQTFQGGHDVLVLPAALAGNLKTLSQRQGATPFMTMLAAFYLLLSRYSGQDDIAVGSPIAGRNRQELEPLIGVFINMLVLRTDVSGTPTFLELLQRVRQVTLTAYSNQDIPFEKLIEELHPNRDPSYTPLFQVLFNMLNFIPAMGPVESQMAGIKAESVNDPGIGSNFDLTLYVLEERDGLRLRLVYNAALFRPERMRTLLEQYQFLLEQIVAQPEAVISQYALVLPAMAPLLPNPAAPLPKTRHESIPARFAAQAERLPEQIAVQDDYDVWTYRELHARSNQLAQYLRANGVQPGSIVAVYGYRNASLVWALLGILKAGAAFTMLDPEYPAARLVEQLQLAQPSAWLQLEAAGEPPAEVRTLVEGLAGVRLVLPRLAYIDMDGLFDRYATADPDWEIAPDGLLYLLFTSGTTGKPKGILGTMPPVSHFLDWHCRTFGLNESDHFTMLSGLAHDPLLRDIFTPLWLGATLYIPDAQQITAPNQLVEWFSRNRITVSHLTPPMGQLLLNAGAAGQQLPAWRYAFFGGDVLPARLAQLFQMFAPTVTCVNYYGATETPQAMGYFVVPRESDVTYPGEIMPLGQGIDGVQLLVLNAGGQLAGVGEVGEIVIRTPYLTQGYKDDVSLTASRFGVNPATGMADDRLYRTGDLGRYLADGQVQFAGRADQQVKIRGFRIELGEIEAVLSQHPHVQKAFVLALEEEPGEKRLVAYVVPAAQAVLEAKELREYVRGKLPAYMIPAAYVLVDHIPLTPNSKVDRRALPKPDQNRQEAEIVSPQTPMETLLADIWKDLLRINQVSLYDNFFDLGGHSLLAIQFVSRVEERTGTRIDPTTIRYQTLGQLAAHCSPAELSAVPLPDAPEVEGKPAPKLFTNIRRLVSKK
ncbi:MAG TPA: amino acid adenylation domain-containing protein, partial [Phototrophicaceae bacterium]|nr:amino acid adenylation domain-containing protein [Phototrophicaceae bacterium]